MRMSFLILASLALATSCAATQLARPERTTYPWPKDAGFKIEEKCPSQDFREFLIAFSSDGALRQEFTATSVWVQEFSDDGTYRVERVSVPKSEYAGFHLQYRNGFHAADGVPESTSTPIHLAYAHPEDGSIIVSYELGMSEGASYLFSRQNGCWHLTEDLSAPAP